MNKALLCTAIASVIAASAGLAAQAEGPAKEKCYGIAKIGKNDCHSADGRHSCAGQASKDNDPSEWNLVDAGTCAEKGGSLKAGK